MEGDAARARALQQHTIPPHCRNACMFIPDENSSITHGYALMAACYMAAAVKKRCGVCRALLYGEKSSMAKPVCRSCALSPAARMPRAARAAQQKKTLWLLLLSPARARVNWSPLMLLLQQQQQQRAMMCDIIRTMTVCGEKWHMVQKTTYGAAVYDDAAWQRTCIW